ncbi:MAG TPA: outer membrane beta-barrel protein [Polyangia bacterium]|nr:outer membrane beta-barrel protein [Polyangia bacterium]
MTVDGLVDSYYQYNFTGSTANTPPALRNFDTNSNTFTLNYARVGLGVSADKAALRIDMGYGATGSIINAAVPPGAMAMGPTAASAFLVEQAFASLTPITNLTIDFGKFDTTAGAEVIQANKNWLYSRSFLFFNIPLVHEGLRIGYKVNDMLSLQGSVVNGWNGQGLDTDVNKDKTFGLNASITLPMGVGILPTIYVGDEGSGSTRFLFDLVGTYAAGPLGLNLNFDYLEDKNAGIDPFLGVAVMGHYALSDAANVTARLEYAQQKAMGATSKFYEGTIGMAFPFSGHYEVRPELRFDGSDQHAFDGGKDKSQVTGTVAALAYF